MTEQPSTEVRERIYAAASELYEQGERERFPTVDAVRKRARVSMNDASTVMRQWRKKQTEKTTPVQAAEPEAVHRASQEVAATIWRIALAEATETLRAAEKGWEAERAETEVVIGQLADAHDEQEKRIAEAEARTREAEAEAAEQRDIARLAMEAKAEAQKRRAEAEARAGELREELEHERKQRERAQDQARAQAERAESMKGELAAAHSRADQIERWGEELRKNLARAHDQADQSAGQLTTAQQQRDEARAEAAKAKQQIAELRERHNGTRNKRRKPKEA